MRHSLRYGANHRRNPIARLRYLHYLNEPNEQASIDISKLQEDKSNCFIEFDLGSRKFQFGQRAFPLIRHSNDQDRVQYPSFVSFVGRTMHGKSFLIRALQYRDEANRRPTPIPAPGAGHNYEPTSSDIHLYADFTTESDEAPILFLDTEGYDIGRKLARVEYPRLAYALSTCLVFVTSGPLTRTDDISWHLTSWVSRQVRGNKNPVFKPSLFVVFNRFEYGDNADFDWSIESSTKTFLKNTEANSEFKNCYGSIHVIYIPTIRYMPAIAMRQLDGFRLVLRAELRRAFSRRRDFRLDFTPKQLSFSLQRALDRLSKYPNSFSDWALGPPPSFEFYVSDSSFMDLWEQYINCATLESPPTPFQISRQRFEKHVIFCLRLCLARNPPVGVHYSEVPPSLAGFLRELCYMYALCGASSSGVMCEKLQLCHGDYHQALIKQDSSVTRWKGHYEPFVDATSRTLQDSFLAALKKDAGQKVSLDNLCE